ncbi:MAG: helix-turn-helix domain-containing protein [Clostridia bacterium]|nr:helix-turn-helix domain-containing protein [Clostridia bacterium]
MPLFYENKNSRYNTEVAVGNLRLLIYDARYLTDFNMNAGTHSHYFYEMFFVIEGESEIVTDSGRYTVSKNDLYIVPPECQHFRSFREDLAISEQVPVRFSYEKLAKGEDIWSLIDGVLGRKSDVVIFPQSSALRYLFEALRDETENHARFEEIKIHALMTTLVLDAIRYWYPELESKAERPSDGVYSRNFIIEDFFSRRYSDDVRLEDLASELNLSEKQTSRILADLYGVTFRKKLTETRIQIAKSLLRYTDTSIDSIAANVGYLSQNGFSEAFRTEVGVSPAQYRKDGVSGVPDRAGKSEKV